jgi:hypothetical protein
MRVKGPGTPDQAILDGPSSRPLGGSTAELFYSLLLLLLLISTFPIVAHDEFQIDF